MKKAQAAMEFLMTYGWAILVVLLAIAALAYFGVLNPGKYLPSSCTLGTGLSCTDFKVDGTANTVTLVIRNGIGEDLNPFSVSIAGDCVGGASATDGLVDGEQETIVISCGSDITSTKFKEDIIMTYTGESLLPHTKTGSISTQVE
ncbi:MAG: hypothetical protein KKA61_02770 [Nanoarchaeota archaeon]|nr:hypothetical protein [Nanoarchaeota archaeon]MBU4493269.1 hypothetical protein [Nanoarchaeota archaeon]